MCCLIYNLEIVLGCVVGVSIVFVVMEVYDFDICFLFVGVVKSYIFWDLEVWFDDWSVWVEV